MADLQSPNMNNPSLISPVDPKIEGYLHGLLRHTDNAVLLEMEALARQHNFPIVGRLVGVFLESLANSINAKRVFEFGSGYGYSAYWFAKAVGTDGNVVCTDGNPKNKDKAKSFLVAAKLWDSIDFRTGMAQSHFAQCEGFFDICYNDVDKGDYPEVWLMAKDRIRPGGLYIADNVLWHGRVALEDYEDVVPGWTEAIKQHNTLIFNDPDFDAYINPIRDGVIVARRKT
jgi:predicted O-methyltransferase YrrM